MKEETRTIESIDIHSAADVPFDEGDEVTLFKNTPSRVSIHSDGERIVGKLHPDDTTLAFTAGIRDGRITLV